MGLVVITYMLQLNSNHENIGMEKCGNKVKI